MTFDLKKFTKDYWKDFLEMAKLVDLGQMQKMTEMMWQVYLDGGTIFFMGNGGSAAIASHFAADIGKNTVINPDDRKEKRFHTHALTDNVEWLTALANDLGYDKVFLEQMKNANPNEKDMAVVISSSGNSPNVVNAAQWALGRGMKVAAMVGFEGGKLMQIANVSVLVPVKHYGYVEGLHEDIHHYVVYALTELKKQE